jgi:hypothetical protein
MAFTLVVVLTLALGMFFGKRAGRPMYVLIALASAAATIYFMRL